MEVDGTPLRCNAEGHCALALELQRLLRRWPSEALRHTGTGGLGPSLPVVVRMEGQTSLRGSLKLRLNNLSAALLPEMRRAANGRPFLRAKRLAPQRDGPTLLLFADSLGRVHALGAPAPLGESRLLALGHDVAHRSMAPCPGAGAGQSSVRRKAIDVLVAVHATSDGNRLSERRFTGGDSPCPEPGGDTGLVEDRADFESVREWLSTLLAKHSAGQ